MDRTQPKSYELSPERAEFGCVVGLLFQRMLTASTHMTARPASHDNGHNLSPQPRQDDVQAGRYPMSENTKTPETPEPQEPEKAAEAPAPSTPTETPVEPVAAPVAKPSRKPAVVTALAGAAAGVVLFGGGLLVGTQIGDDSPSRSHSGGPSGVSRPGGSDETTPRSAGESRGGDGERSRRGSSPRSSENGTRGSDSRQSDGNSSGDNTTEDGTEENAGGNT
jgi:type IV secretory pathway VirB10-like protein